jgi:hypothetical protein
VLVNSCGRSAVWTKGGSALWMEGLAGVGDGCGHVGTVVLLGDENGGDTGNARWRGGEVLPDPHEIEIDSALI